MTQGPENRLPGGALSPATNSRGSSAWRFRLGLALASIAGLGVACHTLGRLPPVDFSATGWRVQQGQALWKPAANKPELAGELLLATHAAGGFHLQFSKTPFSLATAQLAGKAWQIELGSGEFRRRGRGRPPDRFAWFVLPRALREGRVEAPWQFERMTDNRWRLRNHRTGESLEGYLAP